MSSASNANTFMSTVPYDEGMLDVGDGNLMYWQVRGNPNGKPVAIVHGGPGGGSPKGLLKAFDPKVYRIILFDQRGCGRSTPHASDPATDMSVNTTEYLLRDMEKLREHLEIEKWMLFGGSWGSGLAVEYAERHPERVSNLVLVAFWLMGRTEVDWLYRGGVASVFPDQWDRFIDDIPEVEHTHGSDPAAAYAALMQDPDPEVRAQAALNWAAWEDAVLSLEPNGAPGHYSAKPSDDLLAFVRICAHFAAHNGWREDGALLRDAGKLAGIPGVIVHGRHDLSCPLGPARQFAQAWPGAKLVVVEDSGHKGSPEMNKQVSLALERFAWR